MLLVFHQINKQFGKVKVLKAISLELVKGEILGLIGENGAGKSTLMNILGGILSPTSGEMRIEGQSFEPKSASDAQEKGIAFIHQELNLFPNLSITENLFVNSFPKKQMLGLSFLDRKVASLQSKNMLEQVGLQISPDTLVENLTPAQQQLVEIAKVLVNNPQIIIFDEPTTSLSKHESQQLFALMQKLKAKGIAMIYISHQLEDVLQLADRIAILRDGQLVGEYQQADTYQLPHIIAKMIGRDMDQYYPPRDSVPKQEALLSVDQLVSVKHPNPLSFEVKEGEILGFYGLVGAGRSEMARMIYGLDPCEEVHIRWKNQAIKKRSPSNWIKLGLGFLTEDRREEGLLLSQSIEHNISLAALPDYSRNLLKQLKFTQILETAQEQAEATQIKYQNLQQQAVATLSGGNQQKVVLAKWLSIDPKLLILDEPTKGIDIGARHEIYNLINQLITNGSGILLISSEIEELLGLCDRILVMSQGRITAEFNKKDFDRAAILEAAIHVSEG